jgi:hypothetical protein
MLTGSFEYTAIGRLKPGVSLDAARADLQAVSKNLERLYPATNTGLGAAIGSSRDRIANDDLRRTLWILLGSVGLLLVITYVNVTNLPRGERLALAADDEPAVWRDRKRSIDLRRRVRGGDVDGDAGVLSACSDGATRQPGRRVAERLVRFRSVPCGPSRLSGRPEGLHYIEQNAVDTVTRYECTPGASWPVRWTYSM